MASSGTALERLPLCGKHYDTMQAHLIDLMEHADMVLKLSCDETQPVFMRSEKNGVTCQCRAASMLDILD